MNKDDLVAYLDSVSADYPHGIPQVKTAQGPVKPTAERTGVLSQGHANRKLWIISVGELNSFSGPLYDLCLGIIEKGMKVSANDVYLVSASSEFALKDFLTNRDVSGRVLFFVGETAYQASASKQSFLTSRGTFQKVNDYRIFTSYSLSQIASDLSLKKEFWLDVQRLMGAL